MACEGELEPVERTLPTLRAFRAEVGEVRAREVLQQASDLRPYPAELGALELIYVGAWIAETRAEGEWAGFVANPQGEVVPRTGTIDMWFDALVVREYPDVWIGTMLQDAHLATAPPDAAILLLPTHTPTQASYEEQLRKATQEQVRIGCGARDAEVRVRLEPGDPRWTWLLVPVWRADYRSAAGRHLVLVSGRTAEIFGEVPCSEPRARRRSIGFAVCGALALAISAVSAIPALVLWPLFLVTFIFSVVGFLALAYSPWPMLQVRAHPLPRSSPWPRSMEDM